MKKIIVLLVALLLLGGGGAGAYFFFMQPAEASIGDTDEHQEAAEADEHGGGHEEDSDATFQYVEMDPLILPIIDADGVSQSLSLVIVLEVKNSWLKTKVEKYQPRLKDAYIQELYGVLNKHAALEGGVVNVREIKMRLHKISDRVLGEDIVQEVLLQVVQQRPI